MVRSFRLRELADTVVRARGSYRLHILACRRRYWLSKAIHLLHAEPEFPTDGIPDLGHGQARAAGTAFEKKSPAPRKTRPHAEKAEHCPPGCGKQSVNAGLPRATPRWQCLQAVVSEVSASANVGAADGHKLGREVLKKGGNWSLNEKRQLAASGVDSPSNCCGSASAFESAI